MHQNITQLSNSNQNMNKSRNGFRFRFRGKLVEGVKHQMGEWKWDRNFSFKILVCLSQKCMLGLMFPSGALPLKKGANFIFAITLANVDRF